MIDDDTLAGTPLYPCGFCGVERPRSALKRFDDELACARCRGKSYAEDDDEVDEVDESEEELDFHDADDD